MGLQYLEGLSLHIVVVTRRRKGGTCLVNPGWCHDDGVSEGPRRSAASGRESGEEGQISTPVLPRVYLPLLMGGRMPVLRMRQICL